MLQNDKIRKVLTTNIKTVEDVLKNIPKNSIDFKKVEKKLFNINYCWNNGDVRTLEIEIHLRGHHYLIFLEDSSIGSGLHTKTNNHIDFGKNRGINNRLSQYAQQPFCFQIVSFRQVITKELFKLDSKNKAGKYITWDKELDLLLKNIYSLFFRNTDELCSHYTLKNKKMRENAMKNEIKKGLITANNKVDWFIPIEKN